MRSRFSASHSSIKSVSPRVPTSEKPCSMWPSAKSSQAARNSLLPCSRCSSSKRRQAGSTFKNVYLTKWRVRTRTIIATASLRLADPSRERPRLRIQCVTVRIALVSPYSWTYPGGVTRHIEALASELSASGHEPTILAPFDPDDALSARLHRGARPQRHPTPERFVSLGRTVGLPANGAVSNLSVLPHALHTLRHQLRSGAYDVAHIHEPVVPVISWDALCSAGELPLVGTFHTY